MAYCLIDERWIPVRRASGKTEFIAPWQIAERDDPPLRVESPRPDFDAALLEFLIGLVQTVYTPADEEEWQARYEEGLDAADLRRRMNAVRDAFFLDGDGPRFMQDLTVQQDPRADTREVVGLLIDQGTAGDAALFAKSGQFEALSYPAAAAALLTLQTFAPSGGRGQRTSLRGGGPLSVTLQDETLGRTVWCNVLAAGAWTTLPGNHRLKAPAATFPWLAPTRAADTAGKTAPEHVHPFQHFWGLPRRVRLVFDGNRGDCAVYGTSNVPVVRTWMGRPDGVAYEGPFRHPLTPYTEGKKPTEAPNPRKGNRSGAPYRDWPLLVTGGGTFVPPKAVENFMEAERWRSAKVHRLSARGYAMDNAKPLRFVEAEAPVLHVSKAVLHRLRGDAVSLVEASESVRRTINQQVKSAWSDRREDVKGDVDARTESSFWSLTEQGFFTAIGLLRDALERIDEEARSSAKKGFLVALHHGAMAVFDGLCPVDAELGPGDLARLVRARRALERFTAPDEPQLLKAAGLLADSSEKKPPRGGGTTRRRQKETT